MSVAELRRQVRDLEAENESLRKAAWSWTRVEALGRLLGSPLLGRSTAMDAELQEVITPVEVCIESETQNVELGPASREALRVEQVRDLRDALDEVAALAAEPLDNLNRAQLEDLQRNLAFAQRASSALWWLIPADAYSGGSED